MQEKVSGSTRIRADDRLTETMEEGVVGTVFRFMAIRIAVAETQEFCRSLHLEGDHGGGSGNNATLGIDRGDGDRNGIPSVTGHGVAVRRDPQGNRIAGRLDLGPGDFLPVGGGNGLQGSGLVRHLPVGHGVGIDLLHSEGFAIEEEFRLLGIGDDHHADRLAFATLPVPMRRDRKDGTILDPHRLMDEEGGLGETAKVHAAEERSGARPGKGSRLATVVESGPDKAPGHERP